MKKLNIKKIKPMFNGVITTLDRYTEEDFGGSTIIDITKLNAVKEFQTILAVGTNVRPEVTVGSFIKINPARYELKAYDKGSIKNDMQEYKQVTKYAFNIIELDGKDCLFIYDNDIEYIIEEFEEVEIEDKPKSKLILPKNSIDINL